MAKKAPAVLWCCPSLIARSDQTKRECRFGSDKTDYRRLFALRSKAGYPKRVIAIASNLWLV
jgi:hypothetical protein